MELRNGQIAVESMEKAKRRAKMLGMIGMMTTAGACAWLIWIWRMERGIKNKFEDLFPGRVSRKCAEAGRGKEVGGLSLLRMRRLLVVFDDGSRYEVCAEKKLVWFEFEILQTLTMEGEEKKDEEAKRDRENATSIADAAIVLRSGKN